MSDTQHVTVSNNYPLYIIKHDSKKQQSFFNIFFKTQNLLNIKKMY